MNVRQGQPGLGPVLARRPRWLRKRWLGLTLAGLVLAALGLTGWGYWASTRKGSDPEEIWEQGERDFLAGHHERAVMALTRLERMREPTPLDWFLRAQIALARDRTDDALADLAKVPDQHPMGPQARLMTGQIELRRDRVRLAEESFHKALRLDPALIKAHRELIYIYGMQLRRAELNAEFLALSRLTDLTFQNAFDWCLLRNNSWEPGEAGETLSRFVAADPDDRESRLALAENYRRLGLRDEAESALAGLPRQDPAVLAIRAMIALDNQDVDEAERLLAEGPGDDPALARLRGRLALSRRDARSALRWFRLAYDADPDNGDSLAGLLSAMELSGDRKAAEPLRELAGKFGRFNTLLQLAATAQGRDDPSLPRQFGSACAALGRNAEARAWYKLAIARDPLDAEAQRALFRLNAASPDDRATGRRSPNP